MKDFFQEYLAIPFALLLVIFIAPTTVLGGLKLATTLFDEIPACEVRK
jgi:hypothetical protein